MNRSVSHSVRELIGWVNGKIVNEGVFLGDPHSVLFSGVSTLKGSTADDIAFFFSKEYMHEIPFAKPGVLIIGEPFAAPLLASGAPQLKTTVVVSCPNPYWAMGVVSEAIAKHRSTIAHVPGHYSGETTIHPLAVVHPTAKIGSGVKIGPHCVVEEYAVIGDGCVLYPSVYIGPKVILGKDGTFFPKVTLYEWTQVGERARFHAGVVIGADGFGYAPILENGIQTGHQKIYHLGKVIIGDDVEIGANSLIDRGTFGDTTIGSKVKIDNHCHIGHNSSVDDGSILCGGVFLAGGAVVGKFVYIGGMSGVGGRFKVGDRAKVGGMSAVDKEVPPGGTLVGNPGRTHRNYFKLQALLNRMLADRETKKQIKRSSIDEKNSTDSSG
jgi:UDP-3-O-[3-hydroxymyristoyl] glucosamine N-acyltransferase